MKLLFVSNQFPPDSRGGYENLCKEVATAFVERGHDIAVLTSHSTTVQASSDSSPFPVLRYLYREVDGGLNSTIRRLLTNRQRLEAENIEQVRRVLAELKPDGVLVWGMWNIPRSVPAELERLMPERIAYYMCDYWPSLPSAYIQRWEEPARRRSTRIAKRTVGAYFLNKLRNEQRPTLQLKHSFTVSNAVRRILVEKGVPLSHAQVIYGGTQTEEYLTAGQDRTCDPSRLRLIWMGRLEADKGLHTAIEAMAQISPAIAAVGKTDATHTNIKRSAEPVQVTLSVYGKGDPDYTTHVQALVRQHGLGEVVSFCGSVPRSEIPQVLAQHDALLFTSEWDEPFARSPLEALLVGLAVISTTTGGSGEALIDGQTALTYPTGDAATLARQIDRLTEDPELRRRLAATGQAMVIDQFTFERTVNELETAMRKIIAGKIMVGIIESEV